MSIKKTLATLALVTVTATAVMPTVNALTIDNDGIVKTSFIQDVSYSPLDELKQLEGQASGNIACSNSGGCLL